MNGIFFLFEPEEEKSIRCSKPFPEIVHFNWQLIIVTRELSRKKVNGNKGKFGEQIISG